MQCKCSLKKNKAVDECLLVMDECVSDKCFVDDLSKVVNDLDAVPNSFTRKALSGGGPPCGLKNLGNTCFFNSVLQSIFCLNLDFDQTTDQTFTHALKTLFTKMKTSKLQSPTDLFSLSTTEWPEYSQYDQQDSHEFLHRLIEKVPLLQNVFRGELVTRLECDCGHVQIVEEIFYDLSLVDSGDLESAFRHFFIAEQVDIQCEGCKQKRTLRKKVSVKRMPEILILHLKSYKWKKKKKNSQKMHIPSKFLNLNLVSTIEHQGKSMDSGHYIAHIKTDRWYICSDESIRATNTHSQTPYILFYICESKT